MTTGDVYKKFVKLDMFFLRNVSGQAYRKFHCNTLHAYQGQSNLPLLSRTEHTSNVKCANITCHCNCRTLQIY